MMMTCSCHCSSCIIYQWECLCWTFVTCPAVKCSCCYRSYLFACWHYDRIMGWVNYELWIYCKMMFRKIVFREFLDLLKINLDVFHPTLHLQTFLSSTDVDSKKANDMRRIRTQNIYSCTAKILQQFRWHFINIFFFAAAVSIGEEREIALQSVLD